MKKQINPTSGFTLAEVLIVVSIISALSFFLVRNYAKDIRTDFIDQAVAQVLDVRRAALAFYVATGTWPDSENRCVGAYGELVNMLGPARANPWGFELQFHCLPVTVTAPGVNELGSTQVEMSITPTLVIRQRMPDRRAARLFASRLPSTDVAAVGGIGSVLGDGIETGVFAETFVPMVILPGSDSTAGNRVEEVGRGLFYRDIICPAGQQPKAVLIPNQVCGTPTGLFGFRVASSQRDDGSNAVMLEVRDPSAEDGWSDGFSACGSGVNPSDMVSVYQYCEQGVAP